MAEIKLEGQRQIFNNKFLESLTRTHISVPLILFYGTAAGLLIYTLTMTDMATGKAILTFLLGTLSWTLFEYLAHRFIFHVGEGVEGWRKNMQETLHGVHHEFPRDKGRLAMPPVLSIILSTLIILLCYALMGIPGFPFAGGFLAGYASYLVVHYSVHAFRPPRNAFRRLWILHSLHHYKDPDIIFGVSSPLWDYVFRTMPREKY